MWSGNKHGSPNTWQHTLTQGLRVWHMISKQNRQVRYSLASEHKLRLRQCSFLILRFSTLPPPPSPLSPHSHLSYLTTHLSPLAYHPSPLTTHLSPLTSHLSPLTSHLTPHTLHLTPHTSQLSPLTSYFSPLTSHL